MKLPERLSKYVLPCLLCLLAATIAGWYFYFSTQHALDCALQERNQAEELLLKTLEELRYRHAENEELTHVAQEAQQALSSAQKTEQNAQRALDAIQEKLPSVVLTQFSVRGTDGKSISNNKLSVEDRSILVQFRLWDVATREAVTASVGVRIYLGDGQLLRTAQTQLLADADGLYYLHYTLPTAPAKGRYFVQITYGSHTFWESFQIA